MAQEMVCQRRRAIERRYGITLETVDALNRPQYAPSGTSIPQRTAVELGDGVALVFSDAHFWKGYRSVAQLAALRLAKKLKPDALFDVGDSFDGASISRHPVTGFDDLPTVESELLAVGEYRGELASAAPGAKKYWVPGNHCLRFDKYLAQNAPKAEGIKGMTLGERFPDWPLSYGFEVNWGTDPLLIIHNWKGGIHSSHNNAQQASVHFVSGHDHAQRVSPVTNERGTLYGINPGVFADVSGPQFRYTQGRPKNWRSGFAVLTFRGGKLLPPELCTVVDGVAYFRGAEV